ncbi:MAG: hypothetical protein AAF637_21000 [Pseudomonadota bacterium]
MGGAARFGAGLALALVAAVAWSPGANAQDGGRLLKKNAWQDDAAAHHHKRPWHKRKTERNYVWWRVTRAKRQAEIDAYLAENLDDFTSFRTAPLGIKQDVLNFVGIQMIIFRLLPELFPDIWGPPDEKMARIGFGRDPFEPFSVMPLGTGYALSETRGPINVNYMNVSCMGCHSGGVVGPDGALIRTIGGASPLGEYFGSINQTVNDERYTAENFRTSLAAKPLGWVYGKLSLLEQEILERTLFHAPGGAEFFLGELKFASNQGSERLAQTLGQYTYSSPDAPPVQGMPGSLDVFSLSAGLLANPNNLTPAELEAALPKAPGPADIPAAWKQVDRPRFQWDDSISVLSYREVAASLSVSAGDPGAVNLDNVLASSAFTENLPPHPYPFDVNAAAVARGARVYQQACAGCHEPGNDILMTPEETGTDPNRANIFTPFIIESLINNLRAACTAPECFQPDGEPYPNDEVLESTGGYIQIPLNGIWQTAPYLHNGSVPTLYHLLTGDRPHSFYRGNYTYDQKLVGFTWDAPTREGARLYDTSLEGYSNQGHTSPEMNGGIDWKAHPRKLWDLLEYLKTL